jgi:hypothetical protein
MLRDAGYQCDLVTNSREFLTTSISSPDYEFFLVSEALVERPARQLVQWLRRDRRTARIPAGILVRPVGAQMLVPVDELGPYVVSFVEPSDRTTLSRGVANLRKLAGRNTIPTERRFEQAAIALDLLNQFVADGGEAWRLRLVPYQSWLERGLLTPGLSDKAILLLSRMGTSHGQSALAQVANTASLPVEQQQAAADAFADSVDRFGLLLDRSLLDESLALVPDTSTSGDAGPRGTLIEAIRKRQTP